MSTPVDDLFFVNFASVLNKYLGLCGFLLKETKSNQMAVFNAFL